MKIYKLFCAAFLAAFMSACFSSSETPNANTNSTVNSAPNTNAAPPVNKAAEPEITYPKESYSLNTPTEAFQTYIKATVNKDIEGLKRSLSKSSLAFIEKAAKEQGKTVDEILTGGAVQNESKKIPEVRNEKITGDTATVEYKDETMPEYMEMPLVKEDGTWKIALDKFMEEVMKKLSEELEKVK